MVLFLLPAGFSVNEDFKAELWNKTKQSTGGVECTKKVGLTLAPVFKGGLEKIAPYTSSSMSSTNGRNNKGGCHLMTPLLSKLYELTMVLK